MSRLDDLRESIESAIFGPHTEVAVRNVDGKIQVLRVNGFAALWYGTQYGGVTRYEMDEYGKVRELPPPPPPTHWETIYHRERPVHSLSWHWWQRRKSEAQDYLDRIRYAFKALRGEWPDYD